MNLLTILIPTFNRPDFLNLNLEYYKSIHSKYPIFIADGTEKKKFLNKNQRVINFYKKFLNLHYYRDNSFYFERIYKALKFIKTKYCIIQADDDFISLDFLKKGLDILEKNKNINAVNGLFHSIVLNKSNNKFYYNKNYYDNYKISNLLLNSNNLDQRIYEINKFKFCSVFLLQKTTDLIKKFQIIEQIRKKSFIKKKLDTHTVFILGYLYDMICRIYTVGLGKTIFIKEVMCCRMYHDKNLSLKNKSLDLKEILLNKENYRNCSFIYKDLHNCTKIPIEKSKNIVIYSFISLIHLNYYNIKKQIFDNTILFTSFRSRILSLKIKDIFEKLYFNKLFNCVRDLLYHDRYKIFLEIFISKNIRLIKK
jgi:glycosyltransferase domain-containing protein